MNTTHIYIYVSILSTSYYLVFGLSSEWAAFRVSRGEERNLGVSFSLWVELLKKKFGSRAIQQLTRL